MSDTINNTDDKPRYEVRHYTLCDGWINCWMLDDKPQVFESTEEAQLEIDEFFDDIQTEIDAGNRGPDEGYARNEFCIYDCRTGEAVDTPISIEDETEATSKEEPE